jgi:hypothetical protein
LVIMMLAIAFASSARRRPSTASAMSPEQPGQEPHLFLDGRFLVAEWNPQFERMALRTTASGRKSQRAQERLVEE